MATEQPATRSDRARLVPWALWLLTVVISLAALVVAAPITARPADLADYVGYAAGAVWGVTAGLMGTLITSKRRGNRIGWLLVAMGLLASYVVFTSGASETNHPAADALTILSDAGWVLFVALFSVFILLFPDGRPLNRRWRPVIWFVALWPPSFLLVTLVVAPQDLILETRPVIPEFVMGILLFGSLIAISVSAVLRFRRSVGTERQQLKWFAYGTTIGLAVTILGGFIPVWGAPVSGLGLFGPLAGIAVALFRHRLYDIDELISRTFIYGALVAILAGVYTASIRLFNVVFDRMTGLGSEEALVITTLILATTFTPIKKRLEEIVEARYKTPKDEVDEGNARDRLDASAAPADFEERVRAIVREELERASPS